MNKAKKKVVSKRTSSGVTPEFKRELRSLWMNTMMYSENLLKENLQMAKDAFC